MKLILGNCLEKLKELDNNSVDAIVTDPPYGLKFMNKHWDYDVPSVEIWKECFRVLKPGGHLLSFGGTRTYHRMAINIEDAGFEIRDQIQWIYGSGFPKSHNLKDEWQGWGSALKPAFEPVVLAIKPLTGEGLLTNLVRECQLLLFAEIAKNLSKLNLSESTQQSIAQWSVGKNTLTPDALLEVTDMLQSKSDPSLNLSTEYLWLNILDEIYQSVNTFTTEMESSLITDLKTLRFLLSKNIQKSTTQDEQHGEKSNASHVKNLLCAVELKLKIIQISFVTENATNSDAHLKSLLGDKTSNEPICMARKPLEKGLTIAENVSKWGTGAINVNESRIEPSKDYGRSAANSKGTVNAHNGFEGKSFKIKERSADYASSLGRWPANVILDEQAAELLGQPSRFFYVAKASKSERNAGLEGMPLVESGIKNDSGRGFSESDPHKIILNQNYHPTIKPIKLMQYLIKLITPPQGIVLDPFMGSGSTGIAAKQLGFDFIGIELSHEYFEIAEKRITNWNE